MSDPKSIYTTGPFGEEGTGGYAVSGPCAVCGEPTHILGNILEADDETGEFSPGEFTQADGEALEGYVALICSLTCWDKQFETEVEQ